MAVHTLWVYGLLQGFAGFRVQALGFKGRVFGLTMCLGSGSGVQVLWSCGVLGFSGKRLPGNLCFHFLRDVDTPLLG